jgi:hypothetical protein
MCVVIIGMVVRHDLLGVTSFVRATFVDEAYYRTLLHLFHSQALVLDSLVRLWTPLVLSLFVPCREQGYILFVGDQIKYAKEGKKMPAVKYLHQESEDNAKPEYIMGHSIQAVSLLVGASCGTVFAVPLIARICEGLIWKRERKPKTLLDKMASLFTQVASHAKVKAILIADAYYASGKIIKPLLPQGHHLVTRVRMTAVGFKPAKPPTQPKRGRPRKYGKKVKLRNLFKAWQCFTEAPSPVYGEEKVTIKFYSIDLLWKPIGQEVRFVLVKHPTRGKRIFMSTCLDLEPLTILKVYGLRFKIEVGFKQAIHSLGAYAYHFWMKDMRPIKRKAGDQHLERKSQRYREAVQRKMDAYHRYIQLACIAQGILQHLSIKFHKLNWKQFEKTSWMRTMKTDRAPSEMVVMTILRSTLIKFLLNRRNVPELVRFILDRASVDRRPRNKRPAA